MTAGGRYANEARGLGCIAAATYSVALSRTAAMCRAMAAGVSKGKTTAAAGIIQRPSGATAARRADGGARQRKSQSGSDSAGKEMPHWRTCPCLKITNSNARV